MLDAEQESRLRLSEQLLEASQHSSEMEMRASLSHMYYAVHHAARVLTGRGSQKQGSIHADVIRDVRQLDRQLGDQIERLSKLRQSMDYEPDFIETEFGSIDRFRIVFLKETQQGAEIYQRVRELIQAKNDR